MRAFYKVRTLRIESSEQEKEESDSSWMNTTMTTMSGQMRMRKSLNRKKNLNRKKSLEPQSARAPI
jgi:hypothetical protein